MSIRNVFSVDLEDYFMVSAFDNRVRRAEWGSMESRIERNTMKLLEMLDRHGVRATFFVLGWIAEHCPQLVKRIHSGGHEIASHGYGHNLIFDQSAEDFREDVRKSKVLIENIIGEEIKGYRAPSYSINRRTFWAVDVMIELGFRYDSSIFPIRHDRYGDPGFNRFPVTIERPGVGTILEIPPATVRVFGCNIPVAGGGYFRVYPSIITEWAIRRINNEEGKAAVFYIHPWEIDPGQPRIGKNGITLLRHRFNIRNTESKLDLLLGTFRFAPIREVFDIATRSLSMT